MALASAPPPGTPVPSPVLDVAGGAPVRLLWRNELGGLTAAIDGPDPRVVKWSPHGAPDLSVEAERMRWLAARHPAPTVRTCECVGDAWILVTGALPGSGAASERWVADPEAAVTAIAAGLRLLHALDPADCPFDWGVAHRIARARSHGTDVPRALESPPPADRLVVAHGDACAPNTLLDDAGRFLATVDVGTLGVADRWADLAVASMSLAWSYGPGFEGAFWAAYGVALDAERIAFYRALWDAT